jgi:hypothetical protein
MIVEFVQFTYPPGAKGLPLIAAYRTIFSGRYKTLGEDIAEALGWV